MPQLSNQRHERFAAALAAGAGPDAALGAAGYKPATGLAARLSARWEILARVRELGGDVAPPVAFPPPQPSPASGRGGRALVVAEAHTQCDVMAGLVPAIHGRPTEQAWIPGTRPGMTAFGMEAALADAAHDGGAAAPGADPPPAPTRQWVLARLVDNVERALQLGEAGGTEATARGKYDGSVANRALELLGKELGMFTDRSEREGAAHDISDQPLTPEEWARRHVR